MNSIIITGNAYVRFGIKKAGIISEAEADTLISSEFIDRVDHINKNIFALIPVKNYQINCQRTEAKIKKVLGLC